MKDLITQHFEEHLKEVDNNDRLDETAKVAIKVAIQNEWRKSSEKV